MRTSGYLKNAVCAAVTLLVAGLAAGVGCSMDNPAKLGTTVSIKIEDDVSAPKYFSLARDLGLGVHGYRSQLFSPDSMTGPSTSSDFDCFGVNVTGPGIVPNHAIGSECTILDNMHGRGEGLISKKLVRRGEYVDLDLLPGPNRRIDAYGIYPPDEDCGGSNNIPVDEKAYYMGGVDVDIHAGLQVTIPVTFQLDQPPSVACKHDLQLNAGVYGVHEVYFKDVSAVDVSTSAPQPTPSPTYSPLPQGNYADILNPDGTYFEAKASPGTGTYYPAIEFRYNVTNLTMSNFSSMQLELLAAAGQTSGSCPPSGSVDPSVASIEIWNQSASHWVGGLQSLQGSLQPQFYGATIPNPSDFVFPGASNGKSYIIVRMRTAAGSGQCGFIRVDFAAIRLLRNQ